MSDSIGGRPRAFIIESHNLDVRHAAKYGTPTHVWRPAERRPSVWSPDYRERLMERFEEWNYDPEIDYILIAGAVIPLVYAISELVATFGEIKALLYSASENQYVERVLGFHPVDSEAETIEEHSQ